ncbi:3-oxoacyl-ACP synthase III family protein [Bacteriovorax sp. Seq25_V]|uniref:3-oxoacyl-ACP synthase III family protein n=1 Tax=Bacteriovorax sp. Seq25_V TaxID=1201288 RepID=UPI000389ECBF|nr:ketoacyl-ACP synthase III [Bacteriovorax sp. Seq25_V]EQC47702.1 beta-ketoacyl-acyl-carrier-protein synthase III [Bacteriovorax sp. Seq25_V]
MKSLGVKIKASAHYLPENIVSNQKIIEENSLRLKDQWVKDNIGINNRRWVTTENSADLGSKILQQLNEKADKATDCLIVSTVSGEYSTPATACIIQGETTPGELYPAYDITSACAGLMFAIDMGIRYIQTGMSSVKCIATETRSRYLDKKDRRTVMLFGDGASGVTLAPCDDNEIGIFYSKTMSDGRFWNSIVVPNESQKIEMRDASGIFESAIEKMSSLIEDALTNSQTKKEEYSHFIFHQASRNIVTAAAKNLGLREDQYSINFDEVGNTTSASVGILLDQCVSRGKIKKGDLVCMLATGGGFSAAISLMRWEI